MCFSATASFVAGGALSAAGLATIPHAKIKELPLASIPLIFGVQQLADGVVWITSAASPYHQIAAYFYSGVAFAFWPLFAPLAILLVETNPARRRVLTALLIIGIGVSAFFTYSLLSNGVTTQVLRSCIAYSTPHAYGMLSLGFYLVAVCGSFLASSAKMLRMFGIILLVSFGISGWFYQTTFSFTWCFFAALLSAILFLHFHLRTIRRKKKSAGRI